MKADRKPHEPNIRHLRARGREWADTVVPDPPPPPPQPWWRLHFDEWVTVAILAVAGAALVSIGMGWLP